MRGKGDDGSIKELAKPLASFPSISGSSLSNPKSRTAAARYGSFLGGKALQSSNDRKPTSRGYYDGTDKKTRTNIDRNMLIICLRKRQTCNSLLNLHSKVSRQSRNDSINGWRLKVRFMKV